MKERDRQQKLRSDMTETEESYHQAYPDVRAPITSAILTGLFGRNGRYLLTGGVIGVLAAVVFWLVMWRWAI